eukprot:402044_1
MSTQQQQDETLVHGYIRKCQKHIHFNIPNDIIEMIALFYVPIFELLQFVKISTISDEDNNLTLEDNRFLVKSHAYRWNLFVLADIEPIMDGIHCFRVYNKHKTSTGRCYLMWMVSQCNNKYVTHSYDDKCCYGISYSEWFSRGHQEKKNNGASLDQFKKNEIEVDILLDLEKEELRICVVGNKEQEAKIWPVPKCKAGYKPHLHLVDVDITRLCRIPVNWYGLEKDGIFPKDGK